VLLTDAEENASAEPVPAVNKSAAMMQPRALVFRDFGFIKPIAVHKPEIPKHQRRAILIVPCVV